VSCPEDSSLLQRFLQQVPSNSGEHPANTVITELQHQESAVSQPTPHDDLPLPLLIFHLVMELFLCFAGYQSLTNHSEAPTVAAMPQYHGPSTALAVNP